MLVCKSRSLGVRERTGAYYDKTVPCLLGEGLLLAITALASDLYLPSCSSGHFRDLTTLHAV